MCNNFGVEITQIMLKFNTHLEWSSIDTGVFAVYDKNETVTEEIVTLAKDRCKQI